MQGNKEDFVNTNEVLTERRWASSLWRKTGRMRRAARSSPRSLLRGDKPSVRQSAPPLGLFSYAHFPNKDAPLTGATSLRFGEGR